MKCLVSDNYDYVKYNIGNNIYKLLQGNIGIDNKEDNLKLFIIREIIKANPQYNNHTGKQEFQAIIDGNIEAGKNHYDKDSMRNYMDIIDYIIMSKLLRINDPVAYNKIW